MPVAVMSVHSGTNEDILLGIRQSRLGGCSLSIDHRLQNESVVFGANTNILLCKQISLKVLLENFSRESNQLPCLAQAHGYVAERWFYVHSLGEGPCKDV